jgi:hypothetical protein
MTSLHPPSHGQLETDCDASFLRFPELARSHPFQLAEGALQRADAAEAGLEGDFRDREGVALEERRGVFDLARAEPLDERHAEELRAEPARVLRRHVEGLGEPFRADRLLGAETVVQEMLGRALEPLPVVCREGPGPRRCGHGGMIAPRGARRGVIS